MRKSLTNICKSFSNQHKLNGQARITRTQLIEFQKLIGKNAQNAKRTSKPYIEEIIGDIDLFIICLTSLASSCMEVIKTSEKRNKILLSDFPAKDINLGNCLLNISNTTVAINKLCLEGLDTQARVLVRTLDERLIQTPILFASKDDYEKWHKAESPEESKFAHYHIFAKKKKLYKRYDEIVAICLGKQSSEVKNRYRQENEYFYSMAVHGASAAVQVGSWAFDYDSKLVRPNILGSPSSASISTLSHIRLQLFLFMLLFPTILEKFHNWRPNISNDWHKLYMACYEGILGTAHEWLYKKT